MKRRLLTVASVLIIAMLAISPVYAGGVSIKVGYGSITAQGTAWGFGKDAVITLVAEGVPVIFCGTQGNDNWAPGQNPPKVQLTDSQFVDPDTGGGKGKFPIDLSADITEEMVDSYPATYWGCANDNWNADIAYVNWNYVKITIKNAKGDVVYMKEDPNCHTVLDDYGNPVDVYCPAFAG